MKKVREALTEHRYHQALVRLRVLAEQYVDGDTNLNRWDRRPRDRTTEPDIVAQFLEDIADDTPPTVEAIEGSPLQLVSAIDEYLAQFSAQRSLPRPIQCDGKAYWVVPVDLARRGDDPLARQVAIWASYCRRHRVIPARSPGGIDISAKPSAGAVDECLRAAIAGGVLRIFVGHFVDGVTVTFDPQTNGRVRATGMSDPETRWQSIAAMLARAVSQHAHVLVLPELAITARLRGQIKDWLYEHSTNCLALILPGSMHDAADGDCYNSAALLGPDGRATLQHRKLRLFGDADGVGPKAAEDVAQGNHVELLVTPVGTFAVAICKDFFHPDERGSGIWSLLGADWMLVPSFGDEATSRNHARQAATFWTINRIVSIVATQESAGAALPGFLHNDARLDYPSGGGLHEATIGLSAPPARPQSPLKVVR